LLRVSFAEKEGFCYQSPSLGILQMPNLKKKKTTQVKLGGFYIQASRLIAEKEELSKILFFEVLQGLNTP
tara:strand:+ start:10926 stop:11135 length:210 start_codon:yes stop_codon:yes gene_type:complete